MHQAALIEDRLTRDVTRSTRQFSMVILRTFRS
jgi:hypothetical protein